jgi:hypothetical protein
MPMNNRILRPLARPLLLDAVPGAAAAYSLRQLSNAYAGPVVTVRRSSDNAEADFKASEIDDGTLAAFCGAGNGLVKTWHDQSGNGRDASNTTAAQQPKVVDSGSLVTEGGKAALEFDGTNDYLSAQSASDWVFFHSQDASSFFAARVGSTSNPDALYEILSTGAISAGSIGIDIFYDDRAASGKSDAFRTTISNGGVFPASAEMPNKVTPNSQSLFSVVTRPTEPVAASRISAFVDGADAGAANINTDGVSESAPLGPLHIGRAVGGGFNLDGTISEIIIYPSDQSTNRERIEGDINRHFGIF